MLKEKLLESLTSILPITAGVLLLHLTFIPIDTTSISNFLIGALLMLIGLPIFLIGIDISIARIGEQVSEALVKTSKLWVVLAGGAVFGFLVTVAEPDLSIFGGQVTAVTRGAISGSALVSLVSVGVAAMCALALFRIVKNIRLKHMLVLIYGVILVLAFFSEPEFLAIAFDASGCTTGSVSVPFLLALSAGVAGLTRSREKEHDDSFGMLGIASTGAILAVLIQGALSDTSDLSGSLPVDPAVRMTSLKDLLTQFSGPFIDTVTVLVPIVAVFLIINAISIRNRPAQLRRIAMGLMYTVIGLTLFLTGVNTGFIEASSLMGYQAAASGNAFLLVVVGVLFGVVTIPAEPSVHVLTRQIEDATSGSIKATGVMLTLCLGVAAAVGLSVLRILVPGLALWHILLPVMVLAIGLSYVTPDLFVGIGFDSGGVAAGTMTAAFILPFAQGAAEYVETASVVKDAFGVISLVATAPIIAIMLMGMLYKYRTEKYLSVADRERLED